MSNTENTPMTFEDISSSSPKTKQTSVVEEYAEGAFKNIDKVIKVISFLVSISTFLVCAVVAVVLALYDSVFIIVSIGLLIFGILMALFFLFMIYAIGHIITQNKEILKRL